MAEAAHRMPQVGVGRRVEELLFRAQLDVLDAVPPDGFLEITVGEKRDFVAAAFEFDRRAQHRIDVAGGSERREEESHRDDFPGVCFSWLHECRQD
jgi:hypothetical protein